MALGNLGAEPAHAGHTDDNQNGGNNHAGADDITAERQLLGCFFRLAPLCALCCGTSPGFADLITEGNFARLAANCRQDQLAIRFGTVGLLGTEAAQSDNKLFPGRQLERVRFCAPGANNITPYLG